MGLEEFPTSDLELNAFCNGFWVWGSGFRFRIQGLQVYRVYRQVGFRSPGRFAPCHLVFRGLAASSSRNPNGFPLAT